MSRIYVQISTPSSGPILYFDGTRVENELLRQIPNYFESDPLEWPAGRSEPMIGDFMDVTLFVKQSPYTFRCKVSDRLWSIPSADASGAHSAAFALTLVLEIQSMNKV